MGEYRKTFVNRIYTVGLTTCGSALVRIAGATESEGFQKVASFVNKWICGGNNTGQTLAEIQALCNEILNEVKIVDQHLKEYDAEIENTLQKIQYTEAKNELNQQWSKDIDVYETAGNVGNTLSAYEDYMKAAQLYMDGKTDINAVEKSKQKLYDNFIEVYKAAGNSFENPTDEKKKDAIFCNDTIDGVFKRSIWSMINALNKPSDEKNYADAAAQFAYRAYGFSGDQYNYIVSSIDKQFMEIIKMEMMYQEFIAQRGDYFEEKYPDDESKWESYAAWTNDLNKLNEDVAKAMDTMLDREILVSDSTVGSIRMKLDEFVKPEDMVSVRMKNENYHEKLTGEFYENEQPIIDAFNEGYLYGTTKKSVEEARARGKNVILDVDTIGAMKIRALCPDATLIYILPPSWDELKSRLSSTGIYTEEEVNALMEIAEEEISCANSYDYILVNDTISNTLSRFAQIIHSNRYSRNCMKEFLDSYIDGEVKPHVQSYKEALL